MGFRSFFGQHDTRGQYLALSDGFTCTRLFPLIYQLLSDWPHLQTSLTARCCIRAVSKFYLSSSGDRWALLLLTTNSAK